MAEQLGHSWAEDRMAGEVERLLQASPSYAALDNATQRALADSLAVVARAAGSGRSTPAASSLAGIADLRQQMAQPGTAGGASPGQGATGQVQPGGAAPPGAAPGSGGQAGPTSRVGDVARATLNAIDFPAFVAGLIQGTFQAIVDASIQQMEAYAELLKNVAMSLDKFMDDNVSEQSAKDHLADQYEDVFARDTSDGEAKLVVKKNGSAPSALPSFLSDLGFESANDIDDEAVDKVVVPAARRSMAQTRQQTLATMVLMGINRIVVDDGEIDAKLQFHVDASETTKIKFDQKKTTNGTISGRAGRNPFSANAIMVNTVNLNAQSDLNVRADLTGEVKVKFRSETFPLERFADSAAIQLINQNAKVPQAAAPAAPAAPGAAPVPGAPPPATSAAPAAPAPAAPPRPPAAQSLALDPWGRP
ncbi:MAG: hypothetical protein QOH66_1057 [Actinomycetota bacterium]|nr:hypothetical protein [Actinomycetota bacterium]